MTPSTPEPSSRFRRAAEAERQRLSRQRQRVGKELAALEAKLQEREGELQQIEERMRVLESITGGPTSPAKTASPPVPDSDNGREGQLLRGAEIRETAVRVLLADPEGSGPVHYRRWLKLMQEAGYRVEGKRPEAVFLSQITRSPVVRATTKNGIYEIDRGAPQRLGAELQRLQAELRRLVTGVPQDADDLAQRGQRQRQLTAAIRRTQTSLEEALRVLASDSARSSVAA